MSRNKREKNIIIFGGMMSVLLFIILSVGAVVVYNKIMDIEDTKLDFSGTVSDYNEVKAMGISFEEYESLISNKNHDSKEINNALSSEYTSNILNNVELDFFNKNFVNNNGGDYGEHLTTIKDKIEFSGLKESFKDKDDKISLILPIYSDNSEFYTNNSLTSFKFINSVENLLREYRLSTSSTIGATDLVPLDQGEEDKKIINSIESDIFYIPLKLNVVGRKADILRFLTEAKDKGSTSYKDGELHIEDINQIFEVESIEMNDYIVRTPYVGTGDDDLVTVVKKQGYERFEMTMELRFYVVGVPEIKIKEKIFDVIGDRVPGNITAQISSLESKDTLTEKEESELTDLRNRNSDIIKYKALISKEDLTDSGSKELSDIKKKIGHYESLKQLAGLVISKSGGNASVKTEATTTMKTIVGYNVEVKKIFTQSRKGTNIESAYNDAEQLRVIFNSLEKKLLKLLNDVK